MIVGEFCNFSTVFLKFKPFKKIISISIQTNNTAYLFVSGKEKKFIDQYLIKVTHSFIHHY